MAFGWSSGWQGATHCCKECQNPVTWDPNGGLPFDQAAKQELFDQLEKSYISGVTFSGGDPLYPGNRMEITALAKEIREKFPEKTIWMYTGSLWETVKSYEVMKYVDVLVDGEYECDERAHAASHTWKGSSNQRVIDVQDSLRRGQVALHNS